METNPITAITNVRIFDGENVVDASSVVINGARIQSVGGQPPAGATILDAQGATLIPGLIDSHVHTDLDGLRDALLFGITTELEMHGRCSPRERKSSADENYVADLRRSGMGVTPNGGHPTQYLRSSSNLLLRFFYRYPFVSTPDEAIKFVAKQVSAGAD